MLQKITTTRRGFMQLSATSAAALTVGGSLAALTGCSKAPAANGYKVLRDGDLEFLTALAPVVLASSYPGTLETQAADRLLHALDRLVGTLQDYSQSQLLMLFDVMQVAPIRVAMGAQWGRWSDASASDIETFLQDWKTSKLQLKRMGYGSLCKLLCMCWYSQPETFAQTGYPGAPQKIPA
ncbi:twin-arginine translocation signal domain-containing protein [Thalassolituus sp. LLYu03]|uniref:twin-arginine translocation signal domain-containing protein n=1 Tax=Thalassolituus sp. LLYu03 TaxID=3421656 RepID=UPI003D294760